MEVRTGCLAFWNVLTFSALAYISLLFPGLQSDKYKSLLRHTRTYRIDPSDSLGRLPPLNDVSIGK